MNLTENNTICISPSGEHVAIFIDGKWKLFVGQLFMQKIFFDTTSPLDGPEKEFVDMMMKYADTDTCPHCKGDGWFADHGCDGAEEDCAATCPVQVGCSTCMGTGHYKVPERISNDDDLPF